MIAPIRDYARTMRWSHAALQAVALFVACAAGFYLLLGELGPRIADIDALYHYQVASLMRERLSWVDISWLPFTVLGEHGPDHHFLFHVLVAPITVAGHDQAALNVACAVIAAALPAAIFPFLRRAGVPVAGLFALLTMFCSAALPFRFIGLRAQVLAVFFMVATLFVMSSRRHAWLFIVAFLFTESYHGAVILALFLGATLAVQWLYERRIDFRLVTATAGGVFAGLLLSPWFPRNVSYLVFHTVFKTGSADPFLIGLEWLRPDAMFLMREALVAHVAFASGIIALIVAREPGRFPRVAQETLVACIVTAVFLAMTAFAWRFVEYYGPFAIIACALLWRDAARAMPGRHWTARGPIVLAVALLAWGIPKGLQTVRGAQGERFDAFADFMRYVDANDPKPMVFNTFWSDFQHMVYWSRSARYAAGLDGNYLRFGDPARFRLWYDFSAGHRLDRHDNAREIARVFGARWIVVSEKQPVLADNLAQDPDAALAMARPGSGWLFEIRPGPR